MRRIIVSGASGFVGTDLLREMSDEYLITAIGRSFKTKKEHPHIHYISADLLQLRSEEIVAGDTADIFIHAAGQAHIAQFGDAGALFRRNNIEATEAALKLAIKLGVKKFIFISSAVVYNNNPHDLYEQSKKISESRVVEVCQQHNMKYIIVRPTMVYGEDEPSFYFFNLMRQLRRGFLLMPNSGKKLKYMVYIRNLSFIIRQTVEASCFNDSILVARDREINEFRNICHYARSFSRRACILIPIHPNIIKLIIICINLLQYIGIYKGIQVRSIRNLNKPVQYVLSNVNEELINRLPYSSYEGLSSTFSSIKVSEK